MEYGQYCPVAKAAEVLGEKWTILILRELLYGTSRFSEFQRAISGISPTMLNKRLKELDAHGLVIKVDHEYRLTPAGKDLVPLVRQYAIWGMRWARGELSDTELDVELLMSDIRRRLRTSALPESGCLIQVHLSDLSKKADWWLLVEDGEVTLLTSDPDRDPELVIDAGLRALISLWMGEISLRTALARRQLTLRGQPLLIRTIEQWLPLARHANIQPAEEALPLRPVALAGQSLSIGPRQASPARAAKESVNHDSSRPLTRGRTAIR
jgi:DNA-binding HxlR family transcriptional regulator